ncbi:MAG: hydroxymethylglutaryl-CoA lyase [Chloroflexota bacterium]
MSDLPKSVIIHEVGPREGFQDAENALVKTEDKVRLIDALSETGLKWIEVTSFVSPKWVPHMADAEQVVAAFNRKPGIHYCGLYLNLQGLERAVATGKLDVFGTIRVTVSDATSRRNTNRSLEQTLSELPQWVDLYQQHEIPVRDAAFLTAFGCLLQGDIPLDLTVGVIQNVMEFGKRYGLTYERIRLTDSFGWANPEQIKRTIGAVLEHWPEQRICLHMHDTRAMGIANCYAALEMGVNEFDTSVGGLGGDPFAPRKGASGNVCTEDLVLVCQEMGIDTGIDLDKIIECGLLAEEIVGRPLTGKVMKGGPLPHAGSIS